MLVVAIFVFVAAPSSALACSCNVSVYSTCSDALRANVLMVATVTRIDLEAAPAEAGDPHPRLRRRVHLSNVESLRGEGSTSVVTETSGDSCGFWFQVGVRYFIQGGRGPGGDVSTGLCSLTRREEDAVGFVRALRAGRDSGLRVMGQVVQAVRWVRQQPDIEPLAGAVVSIAGPVSRRVTTGRDGWYEADRLPPGEYVVQVTPPVGARHVAAPDRTEIAIDATVGCVEVGFQMQSRGVISGRAVDERGAPVTGAFIELGVANRIDGGTGSAGLGLTTGVDGRFVFDDLPPGRYVVGPNVWGSGPSPLSPYAITHAQTREGDPVIAVAGARVELAPLALRRLLEVRVTGTVRAAAGVDLANAEVVAFHRAADGREFSAASTFVDAAGQFRLRLWSGEVYRIILGPRHAPLGEVQYVAGESAVELSAIARPK